MHYIEYQNISAILRSDYIILNKSQDADFLNHQHYFHSMMQQIVHLKNYSILKIHYSRNYTKSDDHYKKNYC